MKPRVGDIVFVEKVGYFVVKRLLPDYPFKKLSVIAPCIDNLAKKRTAYTHSCDFILQPQIRILCKHSDFLRLKKTHGIGTFCHDLSPLYEKLCRKPIKFVTFRDIDTKEIVTFHLGKATKVLKKVGETHNGNYERIRVVKPMVKLQFIGELYLYEKILPRKDI